MIAPSGTPMMAAAVVPNATLDTRNNVCVVDARVVLRTDNGALIHINYGGRIMFPDVLERALRDMSSRNLIDPGRYYFRTTPMFETGVPE